MSFFHLINLKKSFSSSDVIHVSAECLQVWSHFYSLLCRSVIGASGETFICCKAARHVFVCEQETWKQSEVAAAESAGRWMKWGTQPPRLAINIWPQRPAATERDCEESGSLNMQGTRLCLLWMHKLTWMHKLWPLARVHGAGSRSTSVWREIHSLFPPKRVSRRCFNAAASLRESGIWQTHLSD